MIPGKGNPLRNVNDSGLSEIMVDAKPLAHEESTIASTSGDIVPTFVHFPKNSDELKGVFRVKSMPKGAIDFFGMISDSEKKQDLLAKKMVHINPAIK
jgi:hypothetical protein